MNPILYRAGASHFVIAAALGLFSAPGFAQEAAEVSVDTEELVVTGLRRSLENSIDVKRNSTHVVEALDLSDIDAIPDVTIADALVRLPGVNGARDRGNQSQATVRGLGPRMVLGTVNGRETPSAEPGRGIRYEQYPSELISAVEVYKTQSADLIAGGIAGTINLETVSPMDYNGPTYTVRAGLVNYDGGDDIPDYDSLGNRFSASMIKQVNDQFGFAVGVTHQLQKNAYPSYQVWGYNDTTDGQENLPEGGGDLDGNGTQGWLPWGFQTEIKQLETTRRAAMAVLEYEPNDAVNIKYDGFYTEFDLNEKQNQTWYEGIGNWDNSQAGTFADIETNNGYVVAGTSTTGNTKYSLAEYDQKNAVTSHGLTGEFILSDVLTLDADLNYAVATRDNSWNPVLLSLWWQTYSFDFRDKPSVSAPEGSPLLTPSQAELTVDSQAGEYAELEDKIQSAQADLNWVIEAGQLASMDFGVRYSDREKEVTWWDYNLAEESGAAWTMPEFEDGMLSEFSISDFDVTPFLNTSDYYNLADFIYGDGLAENFKSYGTVREWSYWRVTENTTSAYAKGNFEGSLGGRDYNANIGVRVEDIRIKSYDYSGAYIENNTTEVLPSATFNYYINEDNILRVGLARAISRPPLDELRAGAYLDVINGSGNGGTGNPLLKPMSSNQLDIAYEWYFNDESMFAAALYYKQIEDYIGMDYVSVVDEENDMVIDIWAPENGEGGYVQGFELTLAMPIAYDFGIYSNYAYADSDITEDAPIGNPYALAGMADHTAVVDLWYSRDKIEARLGWKYHSEYTTGFDWGGELSGLDPEQNVSFSISYAFTDQLSVRLQGNNLTNEKLRLSQENNSDLLKRYDTYGKTYLVDLTWKY